MPRELKEEGQLSRSPGAGKPAFRVIQGEGQKRDETLKTRNDVASVLIGTALDLLRRRITPDRANEIQRRVDRVLRLFERVPADPVAAVLLQRELDKLEAIYRDGQAKRPKR